MADALFRTIAALTGALLVTACASPPAASQPQGRPLAVDQVAGVWAVSEVGGGARCQLSLSNLIIDGVRPVLAERCNLAAAMEAKSWRATVDGFELLSIDGNAVMAFRRTGEDSFEEVSRRYLMTRAPIS
jgi:hypothetical protein